MLAYLGRYTHRVAIANSRLSRARDPSHSRLTGDRRFARKSRQSGTTRHRRQMNEELRRLIMKNRRSSVPSRAQRIAESIECAASGDVTDSHSRS
ncbi:transposase [Bradyrhizobium sp. USDA 329]|uniref:transposase n=1 Tax=Bradyrhizobium sp. USDA 329 TaxID=3156310 RepID=UPI003514554C